LRAEPGRESISCQHWPNNASSYAGEWQEPDKREANPVSPNQERATAGQKKGFAQMGVTIDFGSAARRLRPIESDQAAMTEVERILEIKARFKLEMRLALSLLDWKMKLLDASMPVLDKSRFDTAMLEEKINDMKKMLRIATATVEAL
jgi:hypothetical protein